MAQSLFMVSGPTPLVDTMRATLADVGVDADQVKCEAFPGYALRVCVDLASHASFASVLDRHSDPWQNSSPQMPWTGDVSLGLLASSVASTPGRK